MTFSDFSGLNSIHPRAAALLLKDWTTGDNIMWMNDSYREVSAIVDDGAGLLAGYAAPSSGRCVYSNSHTAPMTAEKVIEAGVRPRREKSRQEQDSRCDDRAEVYTPAWQVSRQMNEVDSIWFGTAENPGCGLFTVDGSKEYAASEGRVLFPEGLTWKDYVMRRCIEPCEGEGAYVQTLRDVRTGEPIPVMSRTGMLDRKLRVVHENARSAHDRFGWAFAALRHVWGFEYQGDSLLIARMNILMDFEDWLEHMIPGISAAGTYDDAVTAAADAISRNHIQMDGLSWTVPMTCSPSCEGCRTLEPRLHDGVYAKSYDWDGGCWFRYMDLARGRTEQNVTALF